MTFSTYHLKSPSHGFFVGALMDIRFLKSSLENIAIINMIMAKITLSHQYF